MQMTKQELIELSKCGVKGIEAFAKALEFKKSMEKLQTLAGTSQEQFDELKQSLLAMASQDEQEGTV